MEERNNNTNHADGYRGKPRKNSGKPYKKRTAGDNRYSKRDGNRRDGDRRDDNGERKSYGDRRDDKKRYGRRDGDRDNRDNRGGKRDFKRDNRRDDEHGERRFDRKPYGKRDGDRRDDTHRKPYGKPYGKHDRAPRGDVIESAGNIEETVSNTANQQSQERSLNRRDDRHSERKDDARNGARNDRGRPKVDMTARRDLVQIATTDNSEDFVWAGAGLRHTDSEFFVMQGDAVIHEKYGEGEIVKIISGKIQVEFEDRKRWYAHPLAMEKGILRKPGVPLPIEEPDSATVSDLESALDDELASVLLAAGARVGDFTVDENDQTRSVITSDVIGLEDGPFEEDDNLFGAGTSSLDLDFETITVDDDATAGMFADLELLTGVDFDELDGENE